MKYSASLLIMFLLYSFSLLAQPGTLDKSYGDNQGAEVVTNTKSTMFCSAMQPDDKLLAGGSFYNGSSHSTLAIYRHNKDASIDSSFGKDGLVITSFDSSIYVYGYNGWQSIAIQPDGKIVATCTGTKRGTNEIYKEDILTARFLSDGTPDESFGLHGQVVTDNFNNQESHSIALQTDSKILVAGMKYDDMFQNGMQLLLVRYNEDGTLDKNFGTGYITYPKNGTQAFDLALQKDGKIIVGGSNFLTSFLMLRYSSDGKLDGEFGTNGVVKTSFGQEGYDVQINSLAIDDKGRIVAGGFNEDNTATRSMAIARYLPDGTLDHSFDKDGKKIISYDNSNANISKVLIENDKTIVTGSIQGTFRAPTTSDFILVSLTIDGDFDSSFGTNGQTRSDFGYEEVTSSAAVQSDNKIVLTSGSRYNPQPMYILARYYGYPTKVPLAVRIKRWLHNHGISWKGLPADDKIAYYSVEQSPSSNKGFVQVAKVSGAANLKDYSITNSNLLQGMNYYRIKAVSSDGAIRYSEVASADNTANTASVFPNPAQSYVTVQGLKTNETANISIKNANGNVMVQGVSSGGTQYRSSVSNLQPGTYYMDITTKDKTETLKFVKE